MSNYVLAIYPLGVKDLHITVGYFSNVSPHEIKTINACWKGYVKAKVIPSAGRNLYLSKQNQHYHFDKPLSPGGKSIIVKGALEKMIYNFRNFLKATFPAIYNKMSTRMLEPHINVGSHVSKWKTLNIGPFLLISSANGGRSRSRSRSRSKSRSPKN